MRTLLMANGWGGWQVCRWLRQQNEELAAIVIHPSEKQKYLDEILEAAQLPSDRIIEAPRIREPETVRFLESLAPDLIVLAFFGYIVKPDVIAIPSMGCINVHPSYLPYNRGWHSNVWPFLDSTPAGASIHYIDAGVDTGDIIARREVAIEPIDNGWTIHRKCVHEAIQLLRDNWSAIKAGTNERIPQDESKATWHHSREMDAIDRIDLDKSYVARDLIDLLRARTYPPYKSAYYEEDGRRVYVRVQTMYEQDFETTGRDDPDVLRWD